MLTVMPSMGKTHGVRLRRRPPTKSARNQPTPPFSSAAWSRFLATADPLPPAGAAVLNEELPSPAALPAAVSGVAEPWLTAPGTPGTTVTCTLNGTNAGARQTSSLHAWNSTEIGRATV